MNPGQSVPTYSLARFNLRFAALIDQDHNPILECPALGTFLKRAIPFLQAHPECVKQVAHFLMGKLDELPYGLTAPRPALGPDVRQALHDLLRTHRYRFFCGDEVPEKTMEKLRSLSRHFEKQVLWLNDREEERGTGDAKSPWSRHLPEGAFLDGVHGRRGSCPELLHPVANDVRLEEMSLSDGLDALQCLKDGQRRLGPVRPLWGASMDFGLGLDQFADVRLATAKGLMLLSRFVEHTDWRNRMDDPHWPEELEKAVRCVFPELEHQAEALVTKIVDFLQAFRLASTVGVFARVPEDQIPTFIIDASTRKYLARASDLLAGEGILLSLLYDNFRQEDGLGANPSFGRPENYAMQMLSAYHHVLREAPPLEDFSLESVEKIHAICTGGIGKKFLSIRYGLVDVTSDGIQELREIRQECVSRYKMPPEQFQILKPGIGHRGADVKIILVGHFDKRRHMLEDKIRQYRSTWRDMSAENRLRAALYIGKLADILHVFSDGNSRTGSLVAQYLNARTGGKLYQIENLSHLESRSVDDLLKQAQAWQTTHLRDGIDPQRIDA